MRHCAKSTLATLALLLACYSGFIPAAQAAACESRWPEWETFKKSLLQADGHVIDTASGSSKTTSEGEAYALFFALVANDRSSFDKILNWTEKNLAQGDLAVHLPAWEWGTKDDGTIGVRDENSASDADLWIAYSIGEAGRLWGNRRYVALSSLLADRILSSETIAMSDPAWVLLPGQLGFTPSDSSVRLNPSYVPLQLLRWFAQHSKDQRWSVLHDAARHLLLGSAPHGYAPDWTIYAPQQGYMPDTLEGRSAVGSYDAIRVYLWAGMLNPGDADRRAVLDKFKPMAKLIERQGMPPESIHIETGVSSEAGSSGFSAAMLPFLQAEQMDKAVTQQLQRIEAQAIEPDHYYDQVLSLFGLGWQHNRYRFEANGNLTPRWTSTCP